jgi:adenylosuccinate lyase
LIQRYSIPEMTEIWSTHSRYSRWLEIEILAVEARFRAGEVPEEDYRKISVNASFDADRIDEIEKTVHHDVIAFLTSVSESLGGESRHIHYGMTSSDILDTCLATQIRDSGRLISAELDRYGEALSGLVQKGRGMVCMGRSHGMFAEPTTAAIKFAGHYAEYRRCRARLETGLEEACTGKLSGAVGTFAHLDPSVEEFVCAKLGLNREDVSTQVVARDRHAAFLYALASIGCALERLATEVRHLQRSEVGELEESFGSGQKGSSAMPHKRNPIISERLCGLSRLLRSYLTVGLENTALWHERDISHSSAERFVFPDACGVCLYGLRKATGLVEGMVLYPERMKSNIEAAGDRYHSQALLLALIGKGLSREESYAVVQKAAMNAMKGNRSFSEAAAGTPEITEHLDAGEIDALCTIDIHTRNEESILQRLGL